ncbi:hypothetical protein FGG08_001729 [Glutinoglossum americanum]|uniref:Transmembrane protein n=1 Tax=Glutinoglossum americanum TaxID=1670608 RepID=A0A9P8L2D5_9PEZI|nr:hypothetical protein FGG08_001729 [Glutinoglossum americanum]
MGDEKNKAEAKMASEDVPQPDSPTRTFEGWPPEPESLKKSGFSYYLGLIVDIACIAAAVPFFVLAGAVARLDGRSASDNQWWWIYGGMNARFECGTTLGFLEQLLASSSLVGALQAQWSLRVFNTAGVVLVALGVLSPLGGQSSLQMLKRKDIPIISTTNATYLNSTQHSWFESGAEFWGMLGPLNAMYTSSLMAPISVKNSTMDLWGNVKIPILSQLKTSPNSTGWQDVPIQGVSYSSLAGIPITSLPKEANSTFTVETSYMDLDCYNVTIGKYITPATSPGPGGATNTTGVFYGLSTSTTTFVVAIDGTGVSQIAPQRTLLFQSQSLKGHILAYCHISTAYVEAAVKCTGDLRQVTSMRPSQRFHEDPRVVPLEFQPTLNDFIQSLQSSTGSNAPGSSSTTEFYIADPDDPLTTAYRALVDLSTLPRMQMSVRLGQVINTYYLGSVAPFDIMKPPGSPLNSTNATVTAFSTINRSTYVCQWGWWVIFLLATVAMLVTACIGAFRHHQSTGPDILGYVSSMTRDSPFVRLPPGGSALGGMDRARLLKGMKAQLADVQEEDELGRLAFASPGKDTEQPSQDRLYI